MRKLLLMGVMVLCVGFVYGQDEGVKETVIKGKDETYDDIEYMKENFGDAKIGEIFEVKPGNVIEKVEEPKEEEVAETPSPASETKKVESSSSSRNVTSSGSSSSSSTRKSSSRKRAKRKKISLKRSRPKRMKRKRKLRNRPICPRF